MKTANPDVHHLSNVQIEVLLLGIENKLARSSMGWSYDDGAQPLRIYQPATVRSLWKLGLLGANFDDPRGVGPLSQARLVENLDGARFKHSPEVRQLRVWTNQPAWPCAPARNPA